MFNASFGNEHVRYFVAGDAYGDPCLWADARHDAGECDDCNALILREGLMWGPAIVLIKRDTVPAVWHAACATLTTR